MPENKKRRRWRAYLDDFQKDATGQYVYTGKRYAFVGNAGERKKYFAKIVVFGLIGLLATAAPEFFPPVAISQTPVTVVPWLLQAVAVLLTCWSIFRILTHASELRAYVYQATVPTLPAKSMIAAILSGVTLICQIVFLLANQLAFNGFTAVRLVGSAIAVAAEILLFLAVRAGKWEEKV